jgi:dipeptidyl aminopeptidase/acylaminoacyl peptidase
VHGDPRCIAPRFAAAVLALAATTAFAQEAPHEGDLAKSPTRHQGRSSALLTHTLYAQQQQMITILFRQEFGERIKIKQVWIAARDKALVPAWVFTPVKMDSSKRYPAIVMVHGGFHEHFDERWFKKVDMAISQGYVVIFPGVPRQPRLRRRDLQERLRHARYPT